MSGSDETDLEAADDDDLIQLVAGGDRHAFERLMARNLRRVLMMAQGIVGNASDADEIAQDAFMRVWKHAPRWEPGRARFTTWLYRIVLNLCLDRRRGPNWIDIETVADHLADDGESAHQRISREEEKRAVSAAMGRLSERYRAALVLFYFQEMSGRDAAACMNIKVNAFEQLLLRARRALKMELARIGVLAGGES